MFVYHNSNVLFLREQGSKDIEERSPEKEKRKSKLRGDERKERKMSRKRVSNILTFLFLYCFFLSTSLRLHSYK